MTIRIIIALLDLTLIGALVSIVHYPRGCVAIGGVLILGCC